jgi:hypothetical protein
MAKNQQRSNSHTIQPQEKSKSLSKLQRLETDILDLKEIAEKGNTNRRKNHTNSEGWTRVNRKKALDRQPPTLKINKYKLVIGLVDYGARSNWSNLREEICRDSDNRILAPE